MTLALICSGQGQHTRDMLDPFVSRPETCSLLATAGLLLREDPLAFLARTTDKELSGNRTSQILCVTRCLAAAAVLNVDDLPADTIVAGYSIGELASWAVAGVWGAEQTIELAAARAEAMDQAGGATGLLGYVRGLPQAAVEEMCNEFGCFIAICNPDRLFVVGGSAGDVNRLCDAAQSRGAMRASPMNVRIASHTPMLEASVNPFKAVLMRHVPARSRLKLMNTTRQSVISDPLRAIPDLAAQISHRINWEGTLVALQERGVRKILELGPGSALAEMAQSFTSDWQARSFSNFETFSGVERWIHQ